MFKIKDSALKFWKSWRNKTPIEKQYIKSLEKAILWMKEQRFIKDVLAIYVKGSFVFREINDRSDIDFVAVMKDEKSLNLIREIRNKNKEMLRPVEILPIGIEELKNNEYYKDPLPGTKGKPDQFTLLISQNKLVYGKPLNTKSWKVRNNQKIYESLKEVIQNRQIQMYEQGEFGFSALLKQVMHLIWWEEKLKGKKFQSSWKAIQKAYPKNELLQRTCYLRFHPTKDKKVRSKYVKELKEYLRKPNVYSR